MANSAAIPWQAMLNSKGRAMRNHVPHTLSWSDMPEVPAECPICGREMRFYDQSRGLRPSLDRIIPADGYTPGNVRWVCVSCNARKGNRFIADEELRARAIHALRKRGE